MRAWQVQGAQARLGELLDASATDGPQLVSRGDTVTAVVVPSDERERLQGPASRPGLTALLLGPMPRFEDLAPSRGRPRRLFPVPE